MFPPRFGFFLLAALCLFPEYSRTAVSSEPESGKPAARSFLQKMGDSFQDAANAPNGAVNRMWELMALRELAIINNASVRYYEKNVFFPRDIRQLTLDGFLPKSYEDGTRSKYKFYYTNTTHPDDLGLHADPLDAASGLRYFYVGPDAVIRESTGKPATKHSPLHDYPGRPK